MTNSMQTVPTTPAPAPGVPANTSRWYLERFVARAAASLPAGARVLDAGAGDCPYRGYFEHVAYESADFCQVDKAYGRIDHVCDLRSIPVEDARFDAVVLTQVLEHLPEPGAVLRELRRVLRDGGRLWLSAPLFYEEHEVPHDYFRYTRYGLQHLLKEAGFVVEEIDWLEGYFGTLAYQAHRASSLLPATRHTAGPVGRLMLGAGGIAVRPLLRALAWGFRWLDIRYKVTDVGQCKNYTVVAVAAEDGTGSPEDGARGREAPDPWAPAGS